MAPTQASKRAGVLALLALLAAPGVATGRVSYRVKIPAPAHQLVEVTVSLDAALPLEVAMPTWAPGSFQLRRWARNLTPRGGRSRRDGELRWVRTGASRFRIEAVKPVAAAAGATRLELRYALYAGSFADDASHVDDEHAHLVGPSLFLLIPAARAEEQRLTLEAPRGWRVACALEPDGPSRFRARDYDELVDAPLELGRFARIGLTRGERRIELVLHDAEGSPIPPKLAGHLGALLAQQERWLGTPPYRRYLIVIHTRDGKDYRALEHASGTSLVVPRSTLSDAEDYTDLLYVIAHEHLHVWNGKRLRPAEHLPYDYLAPRPTRLLWWTEGVTDYLARRSLLAAGLLGRTAYLAVLAHEIGRVQAAPERLRLSLADLSLAAFWPPRDPSEPALSYYAKGHVVALLLDLALRAQSGGTQSLERVLRALGASREKVVRLERATIEAALRTAAGADLGPLLARWVDRPGELDYAQALARLGLSLQTRRLAPRADPGFAARLRGRELELTAVLRGGAAARVGLVPGDVVREIDGRTPHAAWRVLLDPGPHELLVARRGATRTRRITVGTTRPIGYELRLADVAAPLSALRERWLSP